SIYAPPSRRLACPMSPAFCRTPRCGRPARALAAQALDARPGAADQVSAPRRRASPCVQPANQSLADDHLARGTNEPLRSCFARLRIRIAHRDFERREPWPEEWLLIEWPKDEKEPTKYWLSTLPKTIGFARLVDLAKLRWRIERDYQELKQEIGLGHYEGRGWRGFHHHATLCIAAYGFLISE